jgi:hypothetical protein
MSKHMRSISILEYKVSQAEFFLKKIEKCGYDLFAVQCYVDAFVASARSITFSMQAVMSTIKGFDDWYAERQVELKDNVIAKFMNDYRRVSTHIGDTVVRAGMTNGSNREIIYFFLPVADLSKVPPDDVFSVCTIYFKQLLSIVHDLNVRFKYMVDDRWYFTRMNFEKLGKTIEDAEVELGFPRGWTYIGSEYPEEERWVALRKTQTAGCQLNHIFDKYIDCTVKGPDD